MWRALSKVADVERQPVASLGLVSPGAATDGCHPVFSSKNLTTLFSHRLWKWWPFPTALPSSYVVYPVFFLNSATNNNFRSGVTRGGPSPQWRHFVSSSTEITHLKRVSWHVMYELTRTEVLGNEQFSCDKSCGGLWNKSLWAPLRSPKTWTITKPRPASTRPIRTSLSTFFSNCGNNS